MLNKKPEIDSNLERRLSDLREGLLTANQIRQLFKEVQEPLSFKVEKKARGIQTLEFLAHQAQQKGEEPLSKVVMVRMAPSMKKRLDAMGGGKSQFIRDAISEKLDKEDP